jgi:hypothetical protein
VDAAQQAEPAHRIGLLAERQALAADVLVGIGDGLRYLRQGQLLAAQPVGVHLHLVLLGLAAEAGDVDHPGHRLEFALEDPVLRRLEVPQRVALAADDVAEHLADGVPGGERGLQAAR